MRRAAEAPAVAAGPTRSRVPRGSDGFFRAAQDDAGRWWMFDSEGTPFFLRGVHGVRAASVQPVAGLTLDSTARLRSWGFNALGVGGEKALRNDGLPFLASAEFCNVGQIIVAPGVRLPDVFDPDWPDVAASWALEICATLADSRQLIGWVTDDRLEWANPSSAGRPSLLQLCLSLEPSFAAYHAAWEFVPRIMAAGSSSCRRHGIPTCRTRKWCGS